MGPIRNKSCITKAKKEPWPLSKRNNTKNCDKDTSDLNGEQQNIGKITQPLTPYHLSSVQGCRNVEEYDILKKISEGSYGVVYQAKDKKTNEIVALKRLKNNHETSEGFSITLLREIKTLSICCQHQNVVQLQEMVVNNNLDFYIVMEFIEQDVSFLMEKMRQKQQHFHPKKVRYLMNQLLSAISHLHNNWIFHRDLKTSNLLITHDGILKVGDFGLAREFESPPLKPYTPNVVTLWYRAPELLLGIKEYSTFIDIWSIGCIFGEFILMNPLFPGTNEIEELKFIFKFLGTPNENIWPGLKHVKFKHYSKIMIRSKISYEKLSENGLELLKLFLTYEPKQRITCKNALEHPYFKEKFYCPWEEMESY